ncbi:hypothetical protein U2718_007435 [Chlorogloeopsis sp. ULAP02]
MKYASVPAMPKCFESWGAIQHSKLQKLNISSQMQNMSKLVPSGLAKLIRNRIELKYLTVKPRAG